MTRIFWRLLAIALVSIFSDAVYAQNTSPASPSDLPLALRYAQACEDLARIELSLAEEAHRKSPDSVSKLRLHWLQTNLEVATEQLRIAEQSGQRPSIALQRSLAQATADHLQYEYELARATYTANPAAISRLQLLGHQRKAEVARLRVELWNRNPYAPQLVDQLSWQVDRLSEELLDLRHRVRSLEQPRH